MSSLQRLWLSAFIGGAALLAACGGASPVRAQEQAPPPAGQYRIEPHHASIVFRVDHLGFSHIVGRFERFQATLDLNPQSPTQSALTANIEAASISSGIATFDQFLRGEHFLNTGAHADISFVSRQVEITGANTARVVGDFTMNGGTHPVTMNVVFNRGGQSPFEQKYIAGFSATGTLARSQWGLGAFAPSVGDDVEFSIEAEFAQAPS